MLWFQGIAYSKLLSLLKFIVKYNIGKIHSLNCIFLGLAFPIQSIKFYTGKNIKMSLYSPILLL